MAESFRMMEAEMSRLVSLIFKFDHHRMLCVYTGKHISGDECDILIMLQQQLKLPAIVCIHADLNNAK